MAKAKTQVQYICQECGAVARRWGGKCESCGAWNSITEERTEAGPPKGLSASRAKGSAIQVSTLARDPNAKKPERYKTAIAEFDRVLGGGLVPGAAVLIGGDPGIGKSTLLLQAVCKLAQNNYRTLYISGEESVDQVRLRAARLGLEKAPVALAAATNVRDILATLDTLEEPPQLVVIDSIQTMYVDTVESAPGTVSQVRAASAELIRAGKQRNIVVLIVGHVTKEGTIAGPRVLEHMVDTVLYFEGDRSHHFRILRGVKNRFGPTDEIGVFEMAGEGLVEVENPSALFLSDRPEGAQHVSGSAVLAALEGTRPMLLEVQALVSPTSYVTPKRASVGYDQNRLAMILAVLESRGGLQFSGMDVHLNVAGGLKINEPAADLAVAAALISALTNKPLPVQTVFFGELGLAGEIRPVAQPDIRLKEAAKLGFTDAVIPKPRSESKQKPPLKLQTFQHLQDVLQWMK